MGGGCRAGVDTRDPSCLLARRLIAKKPDSRDIGRGDDQRFMSTSKLIETYTFEPVTRDPCEPDARIEQCAVSRDIVGFLRDDGRQDLTEAVDCRGPRSSRGSGARDVTVVAGVWPDDEKSLPLVA